MAEVIEINKEDFSHSIIHKFASDISNKIEYNSICYEEES